MLWGQCGNGSVDYFMSKAQSFTEGWQIGFHCWKQLAVTMGASVKCDASLAEQFFCFDQSVCCENSWNFAPACSDFATVHVWTLSGKAWYLVMKPGRHLIKQTSACNGL